MLYMVDMDFRHPSRETEWNAWYESHLRKLLDRVPGFASAQRFRSRQACASPYLAIYTVPGPGIFDSEPYRTQGGRSSTGEWQPLMSNWHRNLFAGVDVAPVVGDGELLVVTEAQPDAPGVTDLPLAWLKNVALDGTIAHRAIAVLPAAQAERAAARTAGAVRVYDAISARLVPSR